jgi:microcystin-dependent protein
LITQRQKRIFFLDRQLTAVGAEMRDDLGKTLHRRLQKNVPHHEHTANAALARVTKTREELMQMWDQQKQTQLSVRSRAFLFLTTSW